MITGYFVAFLALLLVVGAVLMATVPEIALALFWVPLILIFLFLRIRIINEYERGVLFRLGRYVGVIGPGVHAYLGFLEDLRVVDTRIKTIDIAKQEVMTKDNVPVYVNGVVYYRVTDPEKAVLNVRDYEYAIAAYAQTALRDVVGGMDLDDVLTRREEVAGRIKEIVDRETEEWGIDITAIKLQDIEVPQELKRAMARQAEAERERRAVIIKSEGEVVAARNLEKAAEILARTRGAMHLRTLQTINDIAPEPSNKIIVFLPIELVEPFLESLGKKKK